MLKTRVSLSSTYLMPACRNTQRDWLSSRICIRWLAGQSRACHLWKAACQNQKQGNQLGPKLESRDSRTSLILQVHCVDGPARGAFAPRSISLHSPQPDGDRSVGGCRGRQKSDEATDMDGTPRLRALGWMKTLREQTGFSFGLRLPGVRTKNG